MVLLRAARLAGSLVVGLGALAPAWLLARAAGRERAAQALQVALCRLLLVGLGLKVTGSPAPSGPTLLVANHVSWLDVLAVGSRMPVCFLAKSEVAGWPLVGLLARQHGTAFVDRARKRTILPANAAIAARLAAGRSVVLFAEATTSGGPVLPFRSSHLASLQGPASPDGPPGRAVQALAIRFSHPVAAWVGDETLLAHLRRLLGTRPVSCTLRVGAPRMVAPGFDRKALGRALQEEVTEMLAALARDVGRQDERPAPEASGAERPTSPRSRRAHRDGPGAPDRNRTRAPRSPP